MHNAVDIFQHYGLRTDLSGRPEPVGPRPLRYAPVKQPARTRLSTETFAPYRLQRIAIPGARAHVTPLVESAALAAIAPPIPSAQPLIEPTLVTSGALSDAQLEAVIYAVDAHEQTLIISDGRDAITKEPQYKEVRAGFFIGDGGGTGKGRTIAAIAAHNRNAGRARCVWISVSDLLIDSAKRDWRDIGEDDREVLRWADTPLSKPLAFKRGVLFGTYALLRQRAAGKNSAGEPIVHRRIDQLIACLGEDFDGLIALDESHAAANAAPNEGGTQRSLQGQIVLELQDRLPHARILYVSATGAERLDQLSYAPRLGLYGVACPFRTRDEFERSVKRGGLAAMELVAQHLRAQGRYISRTLSLQDVTYDRLTHQLDTTQREWWNAYCSVWRLIERTMTKEVGTLSTTAAHRLLRADYERALTRELGKMRSHFRSTQLYAFSQALAALKMPSVIAYAQDAIARGKAVCLELTFTSEPDLTRALAGAAEGSDLSLLEISHRAHMVNFVRSTYPVVEYGIVYHFGADGVREAGFEPKRDAKGNLLESPAAVARRDELI